MNVELWQKRDHFCGHFSFVFEGRLFTSSKYNPPARKDECSEGVQCVTIVTVLT